MGGRERARAEGVAQVDTARLVPSYLLILSIGLILHHSPPPPLTAQAQAQGRGGGVAVRDWYGVCVWVCVGGSREYWAT